MLDAILDEAADDIGGDTGIDRRLDRRGVRLIDEHRDRPLYHAADLEHLLEHVAARIFEIDQDDIGIEGVDARQQVGGFGQPDDVRETGLAQAFLDDRRTNRALVDDHDFQCQIHRTL